MYGGKITKCHLIPPEKFANTIKINNLKIKIKFPAMSKSAKNILDFIKNIEL